MSSGRQHGHRARAHHRQQHGDIRRHFRSEHDTGQGGAHDAGKQSRHSHHCEPFRLNMQAEMRAGSQSEEQSELRAKHQEGATVRRARSRRIGEGAEREPHEKNQGKHGERSRAKQRSLRDRIASANEIGKKPGERANSSANQRRADFDRPMVEAIKRRHRLQEHAIVDDRHDACERAENEEERPDRQVRHDHRAALKILAVAQNRAGDGDCARRRAERGDRNPQFEPPHQFLEHENDAGDRCVERRGETRARPGGKQHAAIGPIAPKSFADEMAERRGHVHAWPLAAKRKRRSRARHR